ncbi:MAG: hypothetical protein ACE5G8_11120 [Anaerolineae bacterium]
MSNSTLQRVQLHLVLAPHRLPMGTTSITGGNGYIIASTGIIAGNHNDAYQLKPHLQAAFKDLKKLGLAIAGACLNAHTPFSPPASKSS